MQNIIIMNNNILEKSEILFLYDSKYSIPNGDPFTGEQRYDEATKKILVSDVRIKRFVRDYLMEQGERVYVFNDKSNAEGKESGSAARINSLRKEFDAQLKEQEAKAKKEKAKFDAGRYLLRQCVDVRLFGGISTEKGAAVNLTGPVQFAMLNPSLNKVNMRMHQNTSVFSSSADKERGTIGTTTVVPYCVNQIHGWVNPYSAIETGLSNDDIDTLFSALWNSINNANTRTKSNQNALLLIQVVYTNPTDKIYGLDEAITLQSGKQEEDIRGYSDYKLGFSRLKALAESSKVKAIRFITEVEDMAKELKSYGEKFQAIKW